MSWQVHLPALILTIPLLGAFVSIALTKPLLRNLWFTFILAVTTVLAFLLWRRVGIYGTLIYVMGGRVGILRCLRACLCLYVSSWKSTPLAPLWS